MNLLRSARWAGLLLGAATTALVAGAQSTQPQTPTAQTSTTNEQNTNQQNTATPRATDYGGAAAD